MTSNPPPIHVQPIYLAGPDDELTVGRQSAARRPDELPAANLTQLTTPTPAGLPADRRSSALSLSRPVRLLPRLGRPPSPPLPTAVPAAGSRRR
ncbi:hypothetical protein [Kitasatospora sp. NPDC057015]|uniref:hypothetical protein n=1 Tax=Kitasatospora sp. NPDC057015 TaxID=3346001 RepID=UPI00362FC1F0